MESLSQSSQFIRKFGVDFDKVAIGNHLEYLAKNLAREDDKSYSTAYSEVLATEQGQELYRAYQLAPQGKARTVERVEAVARKTEKAMQLEAALEALATQHADQHKTSLAKAYEEILSTPAGSRIYAELRSAA